LATPALKTHALAVAGAVTVGGHDPEYIRVARTGGRMDGQIEVRAYTLVRVPTDGARGSSVRVKTPQAGKRPAGSPLKINRGDQSMRVNQAVQYGWRAMAITATDGIICRLGHYDRRPGSGEGGKGLVAAVRRTIGVAGHNSEMVRCSRS